MKKDKGKKDRRPDWPERPGETFPAASPIPAGWMPWAACSMTLAASTGMAPMA
jgi:hypothetical protein